MPVFRLHSIDHAFYLSDPRTEFDNVEEAKLAGLETAIAILRQEVIAGSSNAVIVVNIADEDEVTVARSAISLSVAPLLTTRPIP